MEILHIRGIREENAMEKLRQGEKTSAREKNEMQSDRKKTREIEAEEHCVVVCYKLITCGWLESDW